jgi:Mechanosensitive ion channel, conserved TM helix
MDLTTLASSLQATLGAQLPGILGALGILIIGWLVAVTGRAGVHRLLALN